MKKILITSFISLFTTGLIAQTNLCFSADHQYNAGTNPYSVITVDLNGDNAPDMAVANSVSNTISVLLNTGTGTFNAAVNYYAGKIPYSITSADFDHDGDIDLAVADNGSDSICILKNAGSGTFGLPIYYTVGVGPAGVVSADFNNDTYADITVSNFGGSVSVLLNSGSGTFLPAVSYTVGSAPYGICAADFDNDAKIDIAITDINQNNVYILQNSGSNSFSVVATLGVGTYPYSITTGDYDQNGTIDVATANVYPDLYGDNISVLFNNGNHNFNMAIPYGVGYGSNYGPTSIISNDFDNDGKMDLATANFWNNSASVILNYGGGFTPSSTAFSVGNYPTSLASADFNNDGKMDLAVANDSSNTASVLLQCVVNGACLNYDSTSGNYVKIDYLEPSTNLTHEMWFKTSVQNTTLFSVTSAGPLTSFDRDIYLFNGNIYADVYSGSSYETIYSTGTDYADGNWHHVAHVIGTSVGGQKLYVDGVLKATGNYSSTTFSGNSKILLGYSDAIAGYGYSSYFQGSMDEVRIWNKALCQIEIQNNMHGEFHGSQTNLAAYYKFNQGFAGWHNNTVTALADSSGGGHNGTLNNFILFGNTSNWISPGAITSGSYTNNISSQSVVCAGDSIAITYSGPNTSSYSWAGPNGYTGNTPNVSINNISTGNSGIYTLTITDAAGCALSSSISVSVAPLPSLTVSATSSSLCYGVIDTLLVQGATNYQWDFNTGYAIGNTIPVMMYNSTNFGVIGFDANGCKSTGSTSVTVYQPPTAGFNYSFATCQCSSVLFTDTTHAIAGDPIVNWNWTFAGQNFHANANTSSVVENIADGNDTICMTITTQSGCVDSTCTLIVGFTSGMATLYKDTEFGVYPNPATSYLKLEGIDTRKEVKITDVIGNTKIVLSSERQSNMIDISSLPSGVYFVRIGNATHKFIKQ